MAELEKDENVIEAQETLILRERTDEESLYADLAEELIDYYIKYYYPSRFEVIKAKQLFSGDETMRIRQTLGSDALNCHRHGLIDSVHDTFTKELLNQNFTPKTLPIHPSKREYTDDAQDAYDWMYHRSRFESDVAEKAYSEAALIGDSYAFFGIKKSGDYDVPTAEHISFWEMFLEPMATSFEGSRRRVVRKISDSIDIIKKYTPMGVDFDAAFMNEGEPEEISIKEAMHASVDSAIYKTDFTKIWDIAFYAEQYQENINECCNGVDGDNRNHAIRDYYETGKVYEDLFAIGSNSKLCEVIEVRDKTDKGRTVKVLVNGYMLPTEDVFFDNDLFGNIYYEENVGSPIHRGIGHKLLPKQRECDLLLFALNNGIKMHAFPDWITDGGVTDSTNQKVDNLVWTGKQRVYMNSKSNIQGKQPFKPIEYISQDVLQLVRVRLQEAVQEAYQDIGINSYILGGDGRVERISAAFQSRLEQSRARLKTIKKSISNSLNTSYYIWLELLKSSKFGDKLLERIDDDGTIKLKDLKIEDIVNNFEVLISSEGFKNDSLDQMGQNILNSVNGMGELLTDGNGRLEFDKKEFASGLATAYGLEGLRFLSEDDKVKAYKIELDTQLEMATMQAKQQKELVKLAPPEAQQGQQAPQQDDLLTTDANGNILQ